MILLGLLQAAGDAAPDPGDLGAAWPWVTGIVTPTAVAAIFYKLFHDAKGERDALQKVMMDELIPLMTRNVDVLKAIEEKLAPSEVHLKNRDGR